MVLATELAKIAICAASLSSSGAWRTAGGSSLRTCAIALVPAAIYLVQNLAIQARALCAPRLPHAQQRHVDMPQTPGAREAAGGGHTRWRTSAWTA